MLLAKYRFNWLLKLAVLCYCQFLFCQFFIESNQSFKIKYGERNITSIFFFVMIFVLIAPVIEELIYRGLYNKNRLRVLLSFIFYIGSSFMLFSTGFKMWWIAFFITPVVIFINWKNNNDLYRNILFLYSSLLFGLVHFNEESTFIEMIVFGGNYLGGGLLLSWVVINFNLFKSILVHLAYNIIVFGFFIVFSNPITIKEKNKNGISFSIEEISIFAKSNNISRTEKSFIVDQAGLPVILANLDIPQGKNVYMQTPIAKFSMQIKDNVDNLKDDEILNILVKSGVIQLR